MSQPVTIIMIEDDEGHARLIERNIRRSGVNNEIVPFSNGTAAVNYLFGSDGTGLDQKGRALLILLDLNLPDMSGIDTNFASLRRFCAIAANVNSNWAPHGPRNRSRPSRRIRFKCANSISTRFLSRHDCLNASVLASARATSRASS